MPCDERAVPLPSELIGLPQENFFFFNFTKRPVPHSIPSSPTPRTLCMPDVMGQCKDLCNNAGNAAWSRGPHRDPTPMVADVGASAATCIGLCGRYGKLIDITFTELAEACCQSSKALRHTFPNPQPR